MKDREPTMRSRELGEELRRVMKEAGYSSSEMARQLDWSDSRVSRLLSGKRGGSTLDVSQFIAVCAVKSPEKERLISLALDQHSRTGWVQTHLPTQLRTLINHESKAEAIREFQFNLIPGVLQTDAYIRALLTEAGRVPTEEIEDRVAAKLSRKKLLGRPNLTFAFYVHEFALRLPVGGKAVMREQLHTLLELAVRPNITLRIVPARAGAHPATSGSFRLMQFTEIPPMVYLDSESSGIFLELPIEIRAYMSILTALDKTALPEGQSRQFISRTAVELYSEGRDDLAKEQFQQQR